MQRVIRTIALALVFGWGTLTATAGAEPLKIEMRLSNPEQLRIEFPLVGSVKHYGAFVKREGVIAAGFTWAGAKVQEVGYHDVFPGEQVRGTGYIAFTLPNGDQVSMKHEFVTAFLPMPDGKTVPVEHGVWTIIGGTGSLSGLRGVGRFQIKRVPDDANVRAWDLTGDIAVVGKK